jgi:hypothetical protein
MPNTSISKSTITFLSQLKANNDRNWFQAHKAQYDQEHSNMCAFVDDLIQEMNTHDLIENLSGKRSLFRIYNDVRFSKDKSPYNPRFAFSLRRMGKSRRGGYYMNIKPGNCYLACGFFNPNPADLKRIREDIDFNYKEWNKLMNRKAIKDNFGVIQGNTVATSPKGYSKEHPAIDLLRHKQFIFRHEFTDKEVLSTDFVKTVNATFKAIRPWFDYMSEVLTTDANGEAL